MNQNIDKLYESLDHSNRIAADQIIQKLSNMQSKTELKFPKIKQIVKIKLSQSYQSDYVFNKNKIKEYDSIQSLLAFKDRVVSQHNSFIETIFIEHENNVVNIESNLKLISKVKELFSYIGIPSEYTELEYKGMKQKSITLEAGYLSDLAKFCLVDDDYKIVINNIQRNINEFERLVNIRLDEISNKEDKAYKIGLFYRLNAHGIQIKSIDDFIHVKRTILNMINLNLGNAYQHIISNSIDEDGCSSYDSSMLIDELISENDLVLPTDTYDILCLEYDEYVKIKQSLLG